MARFMVLLLCLVAFLPVSCSWLEAQDIDVCVEYKGKHVCVGRKGGQWTFSAGLAPEEQTDIIKSLGF